MHPISLFFWVHVKNQPPVLGKAILFWVWNQNGGDTYVFWLIFNIGTRSVISFQRSQRELSIDVTKHRSTEKNYQDTHYPHFTFKPETGITFPKSGVCFYCVRAAFCAVFGRSAFTQKGTRSKVPVNAFCSDVPIRKIIPPSPALRSGVIPRGVDPWPERTLAELTHSKQNSPFPIQRVASPP